MGKAQKRGPGRGAGKAGNADPTGERESVPFSIEYEKRDVELRFRSSFPIRIHSSKDLSGVHRRRLSELRPGDRDDYPMLNWYESPNEWWSIARQALDCGMRVSMAVPVEYAVDVTAVAAQRVGVPLHAIYDAAAGRIVLIHDNEDAIHDKQESKEK